jgi:hypothetical protein
LKYPGERCAVLPEHQQPEQGKNYTGLETVRQD